MRAVVFEDSTGIGTDVLEAHVDTEPGEIVRPETLAKDLERLYGLDLHERIDVALENEHDDEADLVLRTRRAVWQPVQTRIGGLIEARAREAGFEPASQMVEIHGRCPRCRGEAAPAAAREE